MSLIDWSGWAVFGAVATVALTGMMTAAQMAGWSRMDLPLMLGTMFTPAPDRARAVGIVVHLLNGQAFALLYSAAFSLLGRSGAWLGASFGLFHGLAALVLVVPLLPSVHPRMASERSGPQMSARLEPPGPLGLNYGARTPAVTVAAHVAFGAILGWTLSPR